MPWHVRDFTNSPIAVISHSPENCLISLAIITPVCGLGVGQVEADQLLAGGGVDQAAVGLGDLGELLAGEGVDREDQAGDLLREAGRGRR